MASISISTVGGQLVVIQVIPQHQSSLQAPPPTSQAPPPASQTPPITSPAPPPSKMDAMTAALLKGEPQGLGVVQIFIGLLCVLFSFSAFSSHTFVLYSAPFCLAASFVVSGSLSVAVARRTTIGLVVAVLLFNLLSVGVAVGGVAYVIWLLIGPAPSLRICGAMETTGSCLRRSWMMDTPVYGLLGLLLVLLVLQICVSLTVCVFSGKAIRRRHYAPLKDEDAAVK